MQDIFDSQMLSSSILKCSFLSADSMSINLIHLQFYTSNLSYSVIEELSEVLYNYCYLNYL